MAGCLLACGIPCVSGCLRGHQGRFSGSHEVGDIYRIPVLLGKPPPSDSCFTTGPRDGHGHSTMQVTLGQACEEPVKCQACWY